MSRTEGVFFVVSSATKFRKRVRLLKIEERCSRRAGGSHGEDREDKHRDNLN